MDQNRFMHLNATTGPALKPHSQHPIFKPYSFPDQMIDKAVQDFAVGENAMLPAFEALDADGDGTITQVFGWSPS